MAEGMSLREYERKIRELLFTFLVAPAIILVGMAVVGSILDGFLKTTNTFSTIFGAIGGAGGIAFYYAREWKKFVNREYPKSEILENQKKILDTLTEMKRGIAENKAART